MASKPRSTSGDSSDKGSQSEDHGIVLGEIITTVPFGTLYIIGFQLLCTLGYMSNDPGEFYHDYLENGVWQSLGSLHHRWLPSRFGPVVQVSKVDACTIQMNELHRVIIDLITR